MAPQMHDTCSLVIAVSNVDDSDHAGAPNMRAQNKGAKWRRPATQ